MKITLSSSGSCILDAENGFSAAYPKMIEFPTKTRWLGRKLVFQPIGANIAFVLQNWPEANWIDGAEHHLNRYHEARQKEQLILASKTESLDDPMGYQPRTKLFNHQRQAFLLSRDQESFALFHEQGCGKTKVIIDTAAYLYEQNKIDAVVIIAPNGVHHNWIDNEIPKHFPERISHFCVDYSAELRPAELDLLKKLVQQKKSSLAFCTFNVDGFTSKKATSLLEYILAERRCMMVIDESQRIRNHKALRTKYLIKQGTKAKYRRIMTGTPITKGVENIFSQFKFLDEMILGHKSFYTFRAQYCIMGGYQDTQIIGYRDTKELIRTIESNSHRVLKVDCLDLPEKIYKRYPFPMHPEQLKLYRTVKKNIIEELEELLGKEVGAERNEELAVTRIIRLQQITSGWYPESTEDEAVPLPWGNPKLSALLEVLEDTEGKVIIWARFIADLEAIFKAVNKKGNAVQYWGSTSKDARRMAINRFKEDPSVKYFVSSQSVGGTGLDLPVADTAIYYSNSHDLEQRLQSEDRNHRIGTTNRVVYIDLEAEHSIDRFIINALRKKKRMADLFMKDPLCPFIEEAYE